MLRGHFQWSHGEVQPMYMVNSLTEPLRDVSRHQNGVGRANMVEYWPSIPESPISNHITEKQKSSVILYTINAL